MYKIYSISDYSKANKGFIEKNFISLTKTKLKNALLKKNENFHFRIHKNTDYILFGDLDNLEIKFENFQKII
jgi:hypothetical protein